MEASKLDLEKTGTFEVTTIGDCEGKTRKTIGYFEGKVEDIVRYLRAEKRIDCDMGGNFYLDFFPINVQKINSVALPEKLTVQVHKG